MEHSSICPHQLSLGILKNSQSLRQLYLLCQDQEGTALSIGSFLFTSIRSEQFSHVQQNFIEVSKEIYTQGCYRNKDFRSCIRFSLSSSRWERSTFSGSSHERQLKNEKCASSVDRSWVPCQNSPVRIDSLLAFGIPAFIALSLLSLLTAA